MKAIDSNKIIGVKIWENENDWHTMVQGFRQNNNSHRIIEFKKIEDVDKFIEMLKGFKKDLNEMISKKNQ